MTATAATPNLTIALSTAIDAANLIRQEANRETFGADHAYQRPGSIYGDAHSLLRTLLALAYGPDAEDVYEAMIDSDETHSYCATHVAERRAAEADGPILDALDLALDEADANGLTPSQAARKAGTDTRTARRLLDDLVNGYYAHTSGNGAWTHYHRGPARDAAGRLVLAEATR